MIPGVFAAAMSGGGGGGDPYWSSVSALLHFEGPDNSTTFIDETGKLFSPSGSARISATEPLMGSGSGLFDGSAALSAPFHPDFNLGTGEFTIELMARLSQLVNSQVMLSRQSPGTTSGVALQIRQSDSGNKIQVVLRGASGGAVFTLTGASTISTGVTYAVAVTRDSDNVVRLFLNGAIDASGACAFALDHPSQGLGVGYLLGGNGGQNFRGLIDELRVTKGIARYTSEYSPSDIPFPDGP